MQIEARGMSILTMRRSGDDMVSLSGTLREDLAVKVEAFLQNLAHENPDTRPKPDMEVGRFYAPD